MDSAAACDARTPPASSSSVHLPQPFPVEPEAGVGLQLARGKLAQQLRHALDVWRDLGLDVDDRALRKLPAQRIELRAQPLLRLVRNRFHALPHFIGLRLENILEPPVQLVDRVVARRFQPPRVLLQAARGMLDFGKGSARLRDLFFERRSQTGNRLARLVRQLRHRIAEFRKARKYRLLGAAEHLFGTAGKLLREPLDAFVQRELQELVPLRLRRRHFGFQTLAPVGRGCVAHRRLLL